MVPGSTSSRLTRGAILEAAALAVVLLLMGLSWRLIGNVSTAVYRQFAAQGDPPLVAVEHPGPDPDPGRPAGAPDAPSHLGHVGYFWSERAFHYRTALMFAVDGYQDPKILARDTWQQHPDGVDAWRQYTLMMEPVYGYLYRLAGDKSRPFVEFLLKLVPLIHVLIFLPLYAAARGLGAGPRAAALGVAFYASCTLGFSRLTGSLLLKEDFALLLTAGFLAAHAWAWRRGGGWLLYVAGALLAAALASWHLSQFLLLMVLAPAAWFHASAGQDNGKEPDPPRAMPYVYLGAALAAGLTPSLWARGFWASLTTAVLLGWVLAEAARRRRPQAGRRRRRQVLAGAVVVLAAAVFLNRAYAGDYDHVFGLFVQKFAHGFQKPQDPTALPFDVRLFWTAPFLTPTPAEVWSKLGYHAPWLVALAAWAVAVVLRPLAPARVRAFWAAVPLLGACWLLAERMGVVLLVFAAVGMALLAKAAARRAARRWGAARGRWAVGALVLATPLLNLTGDMGDMIRISRRVDAGLPVAMTVSDQGSLADLAEMFAWITRNTAGPGSARPGEPAAFLTKIDLGPQLLLYCRRPVVMNSQFENAKIRERYRRYLELLYGTDERALWDFARQMRADYVVIDRSLATADEVGSTSYVAGIRKPLRQDMVAVRMHLDPLGLRGFRPVFDNSRYRILQVVAPQDAAPEAWSWDGTRSCWWAAQNYTLQGGALSDPAGDRRRLAEFEAALADLQQQQGRVLAALQQRERQGRPAGQQRPDLMQMHRQLAQARLQDLTAGRDEAGAVGPEAAALQAQIQARLNEPDPLSGRPLDQTLSALLGDPATPERGWLGWLGARRGEPLHYATAGQLAALAGRYDLAADLFARAGEFYLDPRTGALPASPQAMTRRLWEEEVRWRLAAGQFTRACDLARRCLLAAPEAAGQDAFLRQAGAACRERD